MFPWDKKRERFPQKPGDFESEIRKLEDEMVNALKDGGCFSCGFSVVSVNGQPVEQRVFRGPVEQGVLGQPSTEEREPLVDIVEEKDHTRVLIDLPGVEKKDIQLTAEDNVLEVKVDTGSRKYQRRIELPHSVKNPRAEYKNGVLEVKVKKDEPEDLKIN